MPFYITEPVLEAQGQLRGAVEHLLVDARELPHLSIDERIDVIERVVSFLAEMLLPHASAHERVISMTLDNRLAGGRSVADSARGEELIRQRLRSLADADPADVGRLQQILYAIRLLASASFEKEAQDYLRLAQVAAPDEIESLRGRLRRFGRFDRWPRRYAPRSV